MWKSSSVYVHLFPPQGKEPESHTVVTGTSDGHVPVRQPSEDFPKPKRLWIQTLAVGSSAIQKGTGWSLPLWFRWPAVMFVMFSCVCTKQLASPPALGCGFLTPSQSRTAGARGVITKSRLFWLILTFTWQAKSLPLSPSLFSLPKCFTYISSEAAAGSLQEFAEPTLLFTNPSFWADAIE